MYDKITALYCRYSRDDGQESENASITHQKELLKEYAENNGYTNLRYYVDDGYTGTNFDRPDFQRMLDDIENGLISTVLVKDMSRFGRNYILVGKYVEIIFPTYHVNVIGVTDNYDSRKSNNDMFAFQNILSELYAADISKKVRAYVQNKGKNGGTVKTRPVYGYRIAPDTKDKWMIDENVADIVCMVFDKFVNEEWSEYKIAKYLREQKILTTWAYQGMQFNHHPYKWTPDLVRRMLGMQEYAGDTVNFKTEGISFKTKKRVKIPKENWLIFKNTHPAIIPRELFNKAQIRLNRERKPFFEKKREYDTFFRGKCRCSECNCHLLVYNIVNAGSVAYNCKNFTDYKVCRSHHVSEETLRNYFKDQIIRLQNALRNNSHEIEEKLGIADISDLQKCLNVVNARIEELNCYIRALFESKVKCEITQDDFAQMSATYSSERNQLQETANELVQKISHAQRNSKKMLHILDYIRNTDFSDMTQEISDTLIERVEVGLFVNRSITHYGEQQIIFYLYDIGAIENLVDTSYLSVRERIEEMIPNEIPKGKVHAEDIAESLGLTYNMMKLALHRENLQFRSILLDKKKEMFMMYLKQGLSAEEICKLIGVKSRENLNSFCWKNFGKSFKMLYKETKE